MTTSTISEVNVTEIVGTVPARFLQSGDRFRWRGEELTADDDPILHGTVVTVPLDINGDNDSVDLPADAEVVVNPERINVQSVTNYLLPRSEQQD